MKSSQQQYVVALAPITFTVGFMSFNKETVQITQSIDPYLSSNNKTQYLFWLGVIFFLCKQNASAAQGVRCDDALDIPIKFKTLMFNVAHLIRMLCCKRCINDSRLRMWAISNGSVRMCQQWVGTFFWFVICSWDYELLLWHYAFVYYVKWKQLPTSFFSFSLCISDLLFCFIALPFAASQFFHGKWIHGDILCSLVPLMRYGSVGVSLLSIAMISINRYKPLLINCIRKFYKFFIQIHSHCISTWISEDIHENESGNLYFLYMALQLRNVFANGIWRLGNFWVWWEAWNVFYKGRWKR